MSVLSWDSKIKRLLPHSLLGRSLLIIVTPLILLQVISAVIFYERHWDNVGRRLANLADNSFSVMSKYKVFDWLELGGAANYRSEIWGGTFAATTYNKLPGYWRFDAFAEAKVTQNFKLTLNVLNVFDKVYYDAFYRSNTPFAYIAPGRTVLLTASARF